MPASAKDAGVLFPRSHNGPSSRTNRNKTSFNEFNMSKTVELTDRDLELRFDADTKPEVRELENGYVVVGYLVHDDDCQSPFDSCDCMGNIYTARRSAGREELEAYREARGLDHEWQKTLKPDPLAVVLDVYSHSGDVYAVSGSARARSFPDQQWDVGHGVAVWVPDKSCREQIQINALKNLLPEGVKTSYVSKEPYGKEGKGYLNKIELFIPETFAGEATPARNEFRKVGYASHKSAYLAAMRRLGIKRPANFANLEYAAAVEMCEGILEEYNKWLSGDCWGICVETFAPGETESEADDACWGSIGDEYAKQEMLSVLKHTVERVSKLPATKPDSNQTELSFSDA